METARSPSVPGAVTTYVSKAALFTVGTSDRGKWFDNAGSYTISLTAAATLGNGFCFFIYNTSGTQTIDPNGAELINGAATLSVSNSGDCWLVECTGTAFEATRMYSQNVQCAALAASGAVTFTANTASTSNTTGTQVTTGGGGFSGQLNAANLANRSAVQTNWNGTVWSAGDPTSDTGLFAYSRAVSTLAGGQDVGFIAHQATSTGVVKPSFVVGAAGAAAWTDGNNAVQISDIYFLSRYTDATLTERFRLLNTGEAKVTTKTTQTAVGVASFQTSIVSTGTPAAGFGANWLVTLQSSTTVGRNGGLMQVTWADGTDATRKSRYAFFTYDSTTGRECLRLESSGTAAMIGFLGSAAVIQQTGDLVAAITTFGLMSGNLKGLFTDTTENTSLTTGGSLTTAGGLRALKTIAGSGFLQAVNTTAKTAAYTCTLNDFKVRFNATTSAIVASLPAAPISGHILCISKTDATANAVTISGTIDGAADPTLTVQYQKKLIMYSGAWESIA